MANGFGMGMRGLPPIKPPVVQGDTQLPFTPAETYGAGLGAPEDIGALQLNPQEQAQRDALGQSQQRMQQALGAQDTAGQGSSLLNNPLVQVGAPALLTALSAIFPRHMRTAGPIGESALSNLNYTNVMQGRTQQAQAQAAAQSATADFNKQRFQYVVRHDTSIDPQEAEAIAGEADVDPKGAATHYALAQQKAQASKAGAAFLASPPTLPANSKAKVDMPWGSVELGGDQAKSHTAYDDAYAGLQKQHPDWDQTKLATEATNAISGSKEQTLEQQALSQWLNDPKNKGKSLMDFYAAKSYAEGAASRAKESEEDTKLRGYANSQLDAIDQGLAGVQSTSRNPKIGMLLNDVNMKRPNPVNLLQRDFEQKAVAAKLNNMQSGDTQKMVNSAVTMNATLNNLEQAYDAADKAGLIPTSSTLINGPFLDALTATTGKPEATALRAAYNEAKTRASLFVNNGYASNETSQKAASQMFDTGLPSSGFKAALNVTRRNANDIVTMASETPVLGIDQNAPALRGTNIGPNATPTQQPGMGAKDPLASLTPEQRDQAIAIKNGPGSRAFKAAKLKKLGIATD